MSSEGVRDNLTAVLYGIEDMRMEQTPVPEPGDYQVLLRMESIGICGSDVHYLVNGKIGPFVVKDPMIIGHEASGTVVRTGKYVTNLRLGDRVAIEPGYGCRRCDYCKEGRYHLCPDMIFCATPPVHGNLRRFYAHDADFCFKLPDSMSLDEGALMEPLAVGVSACTRAQIRFGDSVLILGAGPIGLVTFMAARAMGATRIMITDLVDHRLEKAKELGVTYTLKVTKESAEEDVIAMVHRIFGDEPRASIDCTGAESCVRVALQVTRTGGVVVLVGMGSFEMHLPLACALTREVDIKGVFRYHNNYPTAIEMVRSGLVDVRPLITHHFKIEDSIRAFETAKSGEGDPIKIIIHPNDDWKPSVD